MRTVVLLVTMLLPVIARADGERISVREAVEQALASDHQLKAAGHRQTAATAGVAVSRSRYLPRVYLEEAAVWQFSTRPAYLTVSLLVGIILTVASLVEVDEATDAYRVGL